MSMHPATCRFYPDIDDDCGDDISVDLAASTVRAPKPPPPTPVRRGVAVQLLRLLAAGPRSTAELLACTQRAPATVFCALQRLCDRGQVTKTLRGARWQGAVWTRTGGG